MTVAKTILTRAGLVGALLSVPMTAHAATGTIAPIGMHQYFTSAGAPCASCRVFTYVAGTSTKVSVYTDVGLTVAHSNPITLNSAGRPSSPIFLSPGQSYKFVLAPSGSDDPPGSPIWTVDNISQVPPSNVDLDVQGTAGEALTQGDVVALSDGSSGSTAGRWYKADADFAYLSTMANAMGMMPADLASGSSGSIRIQGRVTGLSALTAGTVYYASTTGGALTSSAPTNARAIGVADSTTSIIVSQWVPMPDASATVSGKVSIGAQTFAGIKTFSSPPVGLPTYSRTTINFTKNNSTTLSDVTGLSFAIGASDTWAFTFILHGISTAVADWKLTLTGPAAPTGVRFGAINNFDTATTLDVAAFGSTIVLNALGGADEMIQVSGLVRNGANAGTVQLQAAQSTPEATNTVIYPDSYVLAFHIQ